MSAVGFGAVSLLGLALLVKCVKYVKRRKGDGRDVQPAVGAAAPGTLQGGASAGAGEEWGLKRITSKEIPAIEEARNLHGSGPASPGGEGAGVPSPVSEVFGPMTFDEPVLGSVRDLPPILRVDVIHGPAAGATYSASVDTKEVLLGRVRDNVNHIALIDGEVSGRHAALRFDAARGGWLVQDLGSLNGTTVNTRAVGGGEKADGGREAGEHYPLADGDVIHLGSATSVRVVICPGGSGRGAAGPGARPPANWSAEVLPGRSKRFTAAEKGKGVAGAAPAAPAARAGGVLGLRVGVAMGDGRRSRESKPSEDVWAAAWPAPGRPEIGLFCVFDGHCGREAADLAKEVLPAEVLRRLGAAHPLEGGAAALYEAFPAADDIIAHKHQGCTGTAVITFRGDRNGNGGGGGGGDGGGEGLYVLAGNVGDSHCVVGDMAMAGSGGGAVRLTGNHRVVEPSERTRLAARGVEFRGGETRLFGLSLSRALGDWVLKSEEASGLSAEPSVSEAVQVPPGSGVVVIASDGLWDVCTPREAVEIAARVHSNENSKGADDIACALLRHAQAQRSGDDVTVLVLMPSQ